MATLNIKNFPDDLHRRLTALAHEEHRSVAQQVIHLLDQAVPPAQPLSLLDLQGLGKELWRDVEATSFVAEERDSWD